MSAQPAAARGNWVADLLAGLTTGELLGAENVFVVTTTLGASTHAAHDAAQHWLEETADQPNHAV